MRAARQPWPVKGPIWLGLGCVAALVAVLGAWGMGAQLSGAVVAPGRVAVERPAQAVQHPAGGVVTRVMVRDGDAVKAGMPLLRLDDAALGAELAALDARLVELAARRARLIAERDGRDMMHPGPMLAAAGTPQVAEQIEGQRRLLHARIATREGARARIAEQIAEIRNQIAGLTAQRAALMEQDRLITDEIADQERLFARGLSREARLTDLRREAARLSGDLGRVDAETARLRARIAALGAETLRQTDADREAAIEALRDIRLTQIDLAARRRALVAEREALVLRAPVDGIVHDQRVHRAGAVIGAGEAALHVVPTDRPFVVQAHVAPNRIDSVTLGQEARLRLRLAGHHQPPELTGTVVRISADIVEDPRSGRPAYRVDLNVTATGAGPALQPGMPVEAFLQTGPRSPISYLIKPLGDHFGRAFREG